MDEVNETAGSSVPEAPDPPGSEVSAPPGPLSAPVEKFFDVETADEWTRVRELALKQLDRFMSLEPKVLRGDDPDAIHDLRVASRRLQQVLDLLYPNPRPREVRGLRRKIRRCRRALGEVRNCDVLLQHVGKHLGRKRTSRREVWTALSHYLHQRRSTNFEKALRKISKVNLAVLYVRLKECLASDGGAPAPERHSVVTFPGQAVTENFHDLLAQSLESIWQAFENQVALSHREPRGPVLHGVRIAAKRLRYLIEVIHAFEVPGSAETLHWLRGLQQHLGEWHDLEVLEQMMIEMIARPEFLKDHLDQAMGVEKLILRNRTQKTIYEQKYFQATEDSPEWKRVKDWVGYVLASPSAAFARA